MKIFNKLAVVDDLDLGDEERVALAALSEEDVEFPAHDPVDPADVAARIAGADAVFVTWRSPIDAALFDANPQLRYVGLVASPYADRAACPVDLDAAAERGVVVSSLGQYGDEATAEWVMASILNAAHHIGPLRWRDERCELYGKRIGIVGLGWVGTEVAARAKAFGMEVLYWSRSRKAEADALGYQYLPLPELLQRSDVVSVHLGKGVQLMDEPTFDALPDGVLLINTSIGPVMEADAFGKWVRSGRGVVIADSTIDESLAAHMRNAKSAFLSDQAAAKTVEMQQRKGRQLGEAAQAFLSGSPIRVVS